MNPVTPLNSVDFKRLQRLGTCAVSNAIEKFGVRLRNEGFMKDSIRCYTPELPPMLGYAVTARAHTSFIPTSGLYYHTNMDWWRYLETMPWPRVMVIQDADNPPGAGALSGELNAAIAMGLGCTGLITNGAVHDLPEVRKMGFRTFAGGLIVSHSYAHVATFGEPVEIGGLQIAPGDLIHGDLHGVHIIPHSIALDVIETAEETLRKEREFVEFCRSPEFSLQTLSEKLDEVFRDGIVRAA
jgi:4-hydroxy-4-methyl-2-oxoglutarate aldolase